MTYLLIQSPGIAPIESYTLLGASNSRGNPDAIGQFGSGSKLAIACLLRAGLKVKVFCGRDRLVFGTRKIKFEGKDVERITCALNGRKPTDLGWVKSWGELDWSNVAMALREFTSNAIDASTAGRGHIVDLASGDLCVKLVEDKAVRARELFTRVFVEVNPGVEEFLTTLSQRFLHFSDTDLNQEILPKNNRSLTDDNKAMIYRQGVYVCQLDGPSVYDYNLSADAIKIDESRNSNEYSVRASIARRLRKATAEELAPILKAIGERRQVMECRLDADYILASWDTPTDNQIAQWQSAWKQTFNDAVMTSGNERDLEYVQRKGYRAQQVDSSAWRLAMGRLGIKCDSDVLSASEAKGYIPLGADMDHVKAVDRVWCVIIARALERGASQPKVACFRAAESAHEVTYYVEDETIYIREDIADASGPDFQAVILQGITEHVTGAGSLTTKFQDFITDLAVILMRNID